MDENIQVLLQNMNNNINEIAYISEAYIATMNYNLSEITNKMVTNNKVTSYINNLENSSAISNLTTAITMLNSVVLSWMKKLSQALKKLTSFFEIT